MKNAASYKTHSHQLSDTTSASVLASDEAKLLLKFQRELQTAHVTIAKLRHEKAQLRAALSETLRKRDYLYTELCAVQQEPLERDQCITTLKKLLTRARSRQSLSATFEQSLGALDTFEAQIHKKSPIALMCEVLKVTEALVKMTSEPVEKFDRLSQDVLATIERSKELLNTPKRSQTVLKKTFSQEEVPSGRKLSRAQTKISICRPGRREMGSLDNVFVL